MTDARLEAIYRYPLKGFSPEALETVDLEAGATIPFDRAWAIENGPGRFDPAAPKHLPKVAFLMLMRDEKLASLEAEFEAETTTLTLKRDGRQVARGNLSLPIGRTMIEQFIAAYMAASLRGAPKIVSAPGHSFSDVALRCVHIVNRGSLRALERVAGKPVSPLRFRPNILIDEWEPWAEFGLIDKEIRIGGARLRVVERTQRCAATEVDPESAARDLSIPALLERTWGHSDFGVYAEIVEGGPIAVGDPVTI